MADKPYKPSDLVTDQAFNRRIGELDRRIAATEKTKEAVETAVSDLLKLGLDRINTILVPAIERINAVAELGFLQATSSTEHLLGQGDFLTFLVPEGPQRDLFTPTKFVTLTRLATYEDYAIARVYSYGRDHGDLFIEVLAIHGDPGPHHDWEITAATGALLAQLELLAQALAAKAVIEALVEQVNPDQLAAAIAAAPAAIAAAEAAQGFAASINPTAIAQAIALKADADAVYTKIQADARYPTVTTTRARLHAALYT